MRQAILIGVNLSKIDPKYFTQSTGGETWVNLKLIYDESNENEYGKTGILFQRTDEIDPKSGFRVDNIVGNARPLSATRKENNTVYIPKVIRTVAPAKKAVKSVKKSTTSNTVLAS